MIRHSIFAAVPLLSCLYVFGADAQPSPLVVLSQQAPNAMAWVLAPLDRAVPEDIRQNLTFLREDLLDEGKMQPKAGLDAYRFGHQLCNSMITALDERAKALMRAGVTNAQANANVAITSQALEARRNYQMSWTQFEREGDQRDELRNQANHKIALANERPKVEWFERMTQLRTQLDGLYSQFRDELRKEPALLKALATATATGSSPSRSNSGALGIPAAPIQPSAIKTADDLTRLLRGSVWTYEAERAGSISRLCFYYDGTCATVTARTDPIHQWHAADAHTASWEDGTKVRFSADFSSYNLELTTNDEPTRLSNRRYGRRLDEELKVTEELLCRGEWEFFVKALNFTNTWKFGADKTLRTHRGRTWFIEGDVLHVPGTKTAWNDFSTLIQNVGGRNVLVEVNSPDGKREGVTITQSPPDARAPAVAAPTKAGPVEEGNQVGGPFNQFQGTWEISYNNGVRNTRRYRIDASGKVEDLAVSRDVLQTFQLYLRGKDVLLDCAEGKVERLSMKDGGLHVDHYNPKTLYPKGEPSHLGTGTLIAKATPAKPSAPGTQTHLTEEQLLSSEWEMFNKGEGLKIRWTFNANKTLSKNKGPQLSDWTWSMKDNVLHMDGGRLWNSYSTAIQDVEGRIALVQVDSSKGNPAGGTLRQLLPDGAGKAANADKASSGAPNPEWYVGKTWISDKKTQWTFADAGGGEMSAEGKKSPITWEVVPDGLIKITGKPVIRSTDDTGDIDTIWYVRFMSPVEAHYGAGSRGAKTQDKSLHIKQ